MKKFVVLLLVLLLCAAVPLAVLATEQEDGGMGFEKTESVTAPRLYGEAEAPGQGFEGYESVTAPKLYEDDGTGLSGGSLVAIILSAVAVVAMLAYFLIRLKK